MEATTPAANLPLFDKQTDTAIQAICDGPAELLCLSRDLISSIYTSWRETNSGTHTGIELKEDSLEDLIYMAFYQRIREGDYVRPSIPNFSVRISRAGGNVNSSSNPARIITTAPHWPRV